MQADTVLYDSTQQASSGSDPVQSFGPLYDSFSTGPITVTLSQLQVVLSGDNTSPGSIDFGLYSDAAGPSTLISDLGTIDDSGLSGSLGLLTVALTANPVLSSGTRYWIGLVGSDTTAVWSWTLDTSGTGVEDEFLANSDGVFPNVGNGGYQMEVEAADLTTPEPSTFALGAIAIAGLALRLRRRAVQ
jgi:hypothetical protein